MTTPPPAGSPAGPGPGPSGTGIEVRPLTAWALLALAAAVIFFSFLTWIFPPSPGDFLGRFNAGSFTNLTVLVAPLLAVLVAARLGPPLPQARTMGLIAVAEYAAALLLGALAFLITIATRFDGLSNGIYAFGGVLQALGHILVDLLLLALLLLAGLWTYQIFTSLGGRFPRVNVKIR